MALSFNTTGPCVPGEHYMLPPERRLARVLELVDHRKYFVLRAGRQTGKTTSAQWLVRHFNQGDRCCCVWADLQTAREQPDPAAALPTVLSELDRAVARDLPGVPRPALPSALNPATALLHYLQALSGATPRPLVLLLDEVDGLVGPAMVTVLTQLRAGYVDRASTPFPHSLALIGLREVRDYVLAQEDRRAVSWLGTTSPFNITAEVTTLRPFTEAEVGELLGQHTTATGQRFEPEAATRVFALSQGQPWLVNALADWCVYQQRELASAIRAADVEAAKDGLILERRTHLDSLIARLHEPRVQRIIEPMLLGGRVPSAGTLDDDFAYVLGLGLLVHRGGEYVIANPIYMEVIPRVLSFGQQVQIHLRPATFLTAEGRLDMHKLMRGWQRFWRQDGHLAAEGFAYREAGPHLMLMAYLQRVVNGGGRIEREYALGRGALDLLVTIAGERHAIELKLRRDSSTRGDAIEQLTGYLDQAGLEEGWLVLFDLRKDIGWDEKLTLTEESADGKHIWVVGC